MIKCVETKKIKKLSFFWQIIKESKLFITFSFFSCILPIIYCLIASFIKPDGSQAVMAVGYASPFLLAFIQISFTTSLILISQIKKTSFINEPEWKKDHKTLWTSIRVSLLIGLLMVFFYTLSSFLYIYFSNNKPNTQGTLKYGLDFIWSTTLVIFLFPIITSLLTFIFTKNKTNAILITLILFLMIITFSFILSVFTPLKVKGIGLGSSISCVVIFLILIYFSYSYNKVLFYKPFYISKERNIITKIIIKESMTSISLSLFKGVAIVFISFWIPLTINGFVPLSYQMSRVIWFNLMYLIPFIGIGVGEAIRFHYLEHDQDNHCSINHSQKQDFVFVLITLILTIFICMGSFFLINPLLNIYTMNDNNYFKNKESPPIQGWGIPTIPPKEFMDLTQIDKIQWTDFPTLKPLKPLTDDPIKNAIIKTQNLIIISENLTKIKNWTSIQISNNPEFQYYLNNLQKWIEWLHQTNKDGTTIISFLETKYNIEGVFKEIIVSIAKGDGKWKDVLQKLAPLFKSGTSYLVYLWLYSKTNPIVTESFINLRQFINFENIIDAYTNIDGTLDVKSLLFKNKLINILPSLFLKIQTFNSKSLIYVYLFSILNSVWAIRLQTTARNFKEGMPLWLMVIIYFLCIGGLVTFGVLFGVILTNTLGSLNPFQYLDAWTFPLVIISILAIFIVSIRSKKSYKFIQKQSNKEGNI